mgnify:CR=1 FL=1
MLKELENNFSLLEKKILNLKKDHQNLTSNYNALNEDYQLMKEKYDAVRKENQELVEENKNIKLQASISGNPDHNRLMKNYINRLIKEVDFCISQLQNNGL